MSEPTMTIDNNGTKRWKNKSGKLHRLNGPAVEWAGGWKMWFQNGHRHRIDGPAVECDNGKVLWYIHGRYLGINLNGFWALWKLLNEKQRQNVNLHMWLIRLSSV